MFERRVLRDANAVAAREAEGGGSVQGDGGREHVAQLVLILGRHDGHARQRREIHEVVEPVVRGTVRAHDAGAVERQRHREMHQADVVHQLVVSALEKRRVDGGHRAHPLARQAAREVHGVLLGNAHVEETVREALGEFFEARSFAHRRRNGHDPGIPFGQLRDGLAEDRRVARRLGGGLVERSGRDVELCHAVIFHGELLGVGIPLALLRHDVEQRGARLVLDLGQDVQEVLDAVPVDRAHVAEPQLLEHQARDQQGLGGLDDLFRELQQAGTQSRDRQDHLFDFIRQVVIGLAVNDPVQVPFEGAHVGRDRHLVVVQNDQHVFAELA